MLLSGIFTSGPAFDFGPRLTGVPGTTVIPGALTPSQASYSVFMPLNAGSFVVVGTVRPVSARNARNVGFLAGLPGLAAPWATTGGTSATCGGAAGAAGGYSFFLARASALPTGSSASVARGCTSGGWPAGASVPVGRASAGTPA